MTLYFEGEGAWVEWTGQAVNGVRHPLNVEQLWSTDDLERAGLYSPVVPRVPSGQVVTHRYVDRVDGVVTWVYTLEGSPLADLNRIQFEFMVEKLGLEDDIFSAIEAMPNETDDEENAKIMALVLFRSGQRFERSHPLFTTLAPAIGLTSEQIDAAWRIALTI
jgi:hypothetical protein